MAPNHIWKTSDPVRIRYEGRVVAGKVLLASGNGVSLFLGFQALLGGHLDGMPVIWDEAAGEFQSIVTSKRVEIGSVELSPLETRVLKAVQAVLQSDDKGVPLATLAARLEMETAVLTEAIDALVSLGHIDIDTLFGGGITRLDPRQLVMEANSLLN